MVKLIEKFTKRLFVTVLTVYCLLYLTLETANIFSILQPTPNLLALKFYSGAMFLTIFIPLVLYKCHAYKTKYKKSERRYIESQHSLCLAEMTIEEKKAEIYNIYDIKDQYEIVNRKYLRIHELIESDNVREEHIVFAIKNKLSRALMKQEALFRTYIGQDFDLKEKSVVTNLKEKLQSTKIQNQNLSEKLNKSNKEIQKLELRLSDEKLKTDTQNKEITENQKLIKITENDLHRQSLAQNEFQNKYTEIRARIKNSVNDTLVKNRDIFTSFEKISKAIDLIDEVAFQTKLLAINASVEAARVAEHGKGFAIVATEVNSLAAKASEHSANIRILFNNSERCIEEAVNFSERSKEYVSELQNVINSYSNSQTKIHKTQAQEPKIQNISITSTSNKSNRIEIDKPQINSKISTKDLNLSRQKPVVTISKPKTENVPAHHKNKGNYSEVDTGGEDWETF